MIDSSAQRVLREYRDQPKLDGQLVLTLADLYGALEDVAGRRRAARGVRGRSRAPTPTRSRSPTRGRSSPTSSSCAGTSARRRSCSMRRRRTGTACRALRRRAPRGPGRAGALAARARRPRRRDRHQPRRDRAAHRAVRPRPPRDRARSTTRSPSRSPPATGSTRRCAAYDETLRHLRPLGLADGLDAQIIRANIGTLDAAPRPAARRRDPARERRRARGGPRRRLGRGGRRARLSRPAAVAARPPARRAGDAGACGGARHAATPARRAR